MSYDSGVSTASKEKEFVRISNGLALENDRFAKQIQELSQKLNEVYSLPTTSESPIGEEKDLSNGSFVNAITKEINRLRKCNNNLETLLNHLNQIV